ncbi:hypothetical protein [Tunicatimonas pelagia]|uniref:hypothetical protein n=1 Tax=Tunicatimonas pelagia TaxID=931531 RepID=UPI002666BE9D|nr:hypothetical protein [Tunicatimonas pelagia]WKN42149.1 hypothetical protein P0M28_24235 [Tunicatimonas pelagia]
MRVSSIFLCAFLLVGLAGFVVSAQAQIGVSPYSSQGIGSLIRPTLVHNQGMGGIGIGSGNALFINYMNPSFLYKNNLTSFDVAFSLEQNNVQREEESVSQTNGGLRYGVFSFPIIPNRWTMSLGVAPFSVVSYRIEEALAIGGTSDEGIQVINGDGGLNVASFSSGFRIVGGLGIGVRVSYLFGPITETRTILVNDLSGQRTELEDQIYYSDLLFEPSISYGIKIGDQTLLNLGATYQPETQVRATREVILSTIPPDPRFTQSETIDSIGGSITLPSRLGVGISVEKSLKYLIGVDFLTQPWESYQSFSGGNDGMRNSYELAVGGQLIPNISSINSYLARMAYRLGFFYRNTPFAVEDRQITDFGLNLGFSLPMSNLSSTNISLELGRRGTVDAGLIREDYFKVSAGITFNDRWFIRRKFD